MTHAGVNADGGGGVPGESVRARPSPLPIWARFGVEGNQRLSLFRRSMGLRVDMPILMTGHQPSLWHCGILAKFLAAWLHGGHRSFFSSWLVVDQDELKPSVFEYPARLTDGSLVQATMDLDQGMIPDWLPPAAGSVREGLERVLGLWRAYGGKATPARRMARVMADLLTGIGLKAPIVFATDLAKTEYFQRWVDAMVADARGCVEAYNAAAAAHASAGIRALEMVGDRVELPLWLMNPSGVGRARVMSDQIDGLDRSRLAPRALLQTAVLRAGACELFIHGTGGAGGEEGEGYDLVMEDWLRSWRPESLHEDIESMAPMAMVTATRYLPLPGGEELVTAAQAERARQAARRARHDPWLVGDAAEGQRKRAFVDQLARRDTTRVERAGEFRAMHEMLAGYRAERAVELAALDEKAAAMTRLAGEAAIRFDRTWPWPLFPKEAIERLQGDVAEALGVPWP